MKRARFIAPLWLVMFAACGPSATGVGGDGNGDGDGDGDGDAVDAGACEDVVDVVFALDTSSSMGFVLDQLNSDIASVVTESNALAADSHFGLIVFQDNHFIDDQPTLCRCCAHRLGNASSALRALPTDLHRCGSQSWRRTQRGNPAKPDLRREFFGCPLRRGNRISMA